LHALGYSASAAMSVALRETKIQIARTTTDTAGLATSGQERRKPDAAICHARELFTPYQDMYFSSILCAGVKEKPAKQRITLVTETGENSPIRNSGTSPNLSLSAKGSGLCRPRPPASSTQPEAQLAPCWIREQSKCPLLQLAIRCSP